MPRYQKGQSGNPKGRPIGAKDKIPRTFRGLAAEVLDEAPDDVKGALREGIRGKQSHRYLAILAGLEKQQHELTGMDGGPIEIRWKS